MNPNQSRKHRRSARVLLYSTVALLVALGFSAPHGALAKSRTHRVALRGMRYVPATLVVNVGDTVVWKNEDIVPHTATDRGKAFDSGSIEPGASWSYTANRKGTYLYYCAYHPNTKGKLIVR
jgi:plastocyanin